MASPHTQPPAQIIHAGLRPARVDGGPPRFAEGSSPDEKTLQGRRRDVIRFQHWPKNQLYPFSQHTCAHPHSHGFRKLPGVNHLDPEFLVVSSIPREIERRFERRWAARFAQQAPREPSSENEPLRKAGARKAKRKTRMAGPAGFKSALVEIGLKK